MTTRRDFLHGLLLGGASLASTRVWATSGFPNYPFTLGVASGYPSPDGIALWTRLAPEPLAPGGGLDPRTYRVQWEIADDEGFGRIVDEGVAYATPEWAHAVHVETARLAPARTYWYRFHAGDATSPTGRFRTAPARDAEPGRLRFAFASCQQYEQGYYAAYRHMLADELELVVHLGDYIYESSWGEALVRRHEGPEPVTLEQYRARHACYRLDPDLQAAHAACAWLFTWDDHEVDNDYAASLSQDEDVRRWMLARRAMAYRAYFEHLPLRRAMTPLGPDLRLHARVPWGKLAAFTMLDTRQYKSPQPCPKPGRAGSNMIEDCAARANPAATMLGDAQERWLAAGLAAGVAQWNLLGQTTLMGQADSKAGPGQMFYSDAWDGYPAARRRLLQTLVDTRAQPGGAWRRRALVLGDGPENRLRARRFADRRERIRHNLGDFPAAARGPHPDSGPRGRAREVCHGPPSRLRAHGTHPDQAHRGTPRARRRAAAGCAVLDARVLGRRGWAAGGAKGLTSSASPGYRVAATSLL